VRVGRYIQVFFLATVTVACSDTNFVGPSRAKQKRIPVSPEAGDAERIVGFKSGDPRKPEVADFLFVLDNSFSMKDDASGIARGLAQVPASSFPASSRLGVMTTMVADSVTADPIVIHNDIAHYSCINKEPGFLDLVNASAIKDWRTCRSNAKQSAAAYSLSGCVSGWFEPFEKNANHERCFDAALQNPFSAVKCEAGLLALKQFLQRKRAYPVFRDGALVTVVFISDEQVGCVSAETLGDPSDAGADATIKEIKDAIVTNSKASGVRFTGILPSPKFVKDNVLSYQKVIERTGGKFFWITEARADYKGIIEKIVSPLVIESSKEFPLDGDVVAISHVKVDGRMIPEDHYELIRTDGRSIVKIRGFESDREVDISVAFKTRKTE